MGIIPCVERWKPICVYNEVIVTSNFDYTVGVGGLQNHFAKIPNAVRTSKEVGIGFNTKFGQKIEEYQHTRGTQI